MDHIFCDWGLSKLLNPVRAQGSISKHFIISHISNFQKYYFLLQYLQADLLFSSTCSSFVACGAIEGLHNIQTKGQDRIQFSP